MKLLFLFFLCIYLLLYRYFNLNINFINYIYICKFILFYLILIFYYILYIIYNIIFFLFKNFRFYKYYLTNKNTAFFYFNKKSIYFLFWRLLVQSLISMFFLFLKNFVNNIIVYLKQFFYLGNIYLFFLIFIRIKYYLNKYYLNNIFLHLYNLYIFLSYHLYYFSQIDEIYQFIKSFNLNIFKYVKDPILNRNLNFTSFFFFLII